MRAAQVEGWSKATHPLRRTPLMLMMRALWGFRDTFKSLQKHLLAGPLWARWVPMMVAPPCRGECRQTRGLPGASKPRGPVEKRGSDEARSAA